MKINLLYLLTAGILLRLLTLNADSAFFQAAPGAAILFAAIVSLRNRDWRSQFISRPTRLRTTCAWLLFVCATSVLIAIFNGFSGIAAALDLFRFVIFCALILLGFDVGRSNPELLYRVIAACLTLCNLGGLASFFGLLPSQLIDGIVRPIGFLGSPQTMAHLALFSVIFFCFRIYVTYFRLQKRRGVGVLLLQLFLAVVMVVLSATLKVALMMPVAILLLAMLLFRQKSVATSVSILVIAMAGVFAVNYGSGLIERMDVISSGVDLQILPGQKSEDSLEFRIIHWRLLLNSWQDGYAVFGTGLGNATELHGFGWFLGHNLDPHNDVLKVLLELGVVGFVIVAVLWLRLTLALLRRARVDPLAAFCLCTIVTFTVVALAGKVFFTAFNLYLFPLLLGCCFGRIDDDNRRMRSS